MTVKAAIRTLRAERFRLIPLAQSADRAMRTLTARRAATSVYHAVAGRGMMSLKSRAGWTERSDGEYVFTFGPRRSRLTVPPRLGVQELAGLITRTEIRALLGDCDWRLLSHLQVIGARHLAHLFSH